MIYRYVNAKDLCFLGNNDSIILDDYYFGFVCLFEFKMIGVIVLKYYNNENSNNIKWINVKENYRRQGIAYQLIKESLEFSKQSHIHLKVEYNNEICKPDIFKKVLIKTNSVDINETNLCISFEYNNFRKLYANKKLLKKYFYMAFINAPDVCLEQLSTFDNEFSKFINPPLLDLNLCVNKDLSLIISDEANNLYGWIILDELNSKDIYVRNTFVFPKFRHQLIWFELLKYLCSETYESKLKNKRVYFDILLENTKMISFARKIQTKISVKITRNFVAEFN